MHSVVYVTAVAVALGVSACSQTDAKTGAKPDSVKVRQAGLPTPVSKASFDPVTHVAVIHTRDFVFEAPDTITAGWTTIRLVNDGPSLHHVQLVRLDNDKTAVDLALALNKAGPLPGWAVSVGGPDAPDPHGESNARLNLAPGHYVLLCVVDLVDRVPHVAKGMIRPMTVTGVMGSPKAEPKSDATITLADFSFTVRGVLRAGNHRIKVSNNGPQVHELQMVRLAPGKEMRDLMMWLAVPEGPPPATAIGGIAGLSARGSAYFDVDLAPGNYGLLCFIRDVSDGRPHLDHGMMKQFAVK